MHSAIGFKKAVFTFLFLMGSFSVCLAVNNTLKQNSDTSLKQSSVMTNQRINALLHRLDPKKKGQPGFWTVKINGFTIMVITDAKADRMRIISQVKEADALDQEDLFRITQANFDSALDARYAIAKGMLWSAYIHPLSLLSDNEFLVGVGQVINLVSSYGSTYSSGALIFGGGDSEALQRRQLIDEIVKKGMRI